MTLPPPPVDFPGWLPPVLVKELRQGLRAKGFVGVFFAFHVLAVLMFWLAIELNVASGLRETFLWLNAVFWGLLNLVLLLVLPLRALAGLRTEMDSRTLDLLVLTRLTSWRIVLGKWIALSAQAFLFLLALMPYGVVRYFFGSVDLMDDLQTAGWMMLLSMMLIACALWVSAMPKLFRILMPIGLFFFVQSVGLAAILNTIFSPRRGGGMRSPFAALEFEQFAVMAILTLVFLALAVRRLAPPAENHSLPARAFALVLLLLAMGTAAVIGPWAAKSAVAFGVVVVLGVSAVELSRECRPMRVHWRPWSVGWRRWVGRLVLPGWPSAALFAAVVLGLFALPSLFMGDWRTPRSGVGLFIWWMVLAWQALVFPALLLSFLPERSQMRLGGSGYFVIQGLFGTVSLLSLNNSTGFIAGANFAAALDVLCQGFPISSFWLTGDKLGRGTLPEGFVGQVISLVVMVILLWRQSRPYWAEVRKFDAATEIVETPPGTA